MAGRQRAVRAVRICDRQDLREQMQSLVRDLVKAQDAHAKAGSLDSSGVTRQIAEQIEAVRAEMEEATTTYRLQALPRKAWRALAVKHPPRDGNQADAALGVNEDEFFEMAIPKSCIEPTLDDAAWAEFFEECSEAEWGQLRDAVVMLNQSDVDIPFSRAALQVLADSETS